MERNSRCSRFVRMRNSTPLFSLGLWRSKAIMATLEQKAFGVLQFAKHESVVSLQRGFRRQFNSDSPSPNSIRRWYRQFQTTGCFCKGKSAGRPRVSEENEWDSLFFAVRRNLCAVRVVNWRCRVWLCGGCFERDCTWSPTVFTCCSFWNRQTTSTEVTFALRCKMQWRRKVSLIVLCLVMNIRFISVEKCTDIMYVYGVLKILTRWCNMKGLPQRSMFLCIVHTEGLWAFLFPWRHSDGNKLPGNATDMALP